MKLLLSSFLATSIFFTVSAQVSVQKAEEKIDKKNYLGAIKILDKLLSANDKDTVCYFLRGRCYFELNKVQKAYNDFSKYIEMRQGNPLAHLYRGYLLEGTLQFFDAINEYNVAVKYGADTVLTSAYFHRGSCYLSINSKKQAYQDFCIAYTRNPNDKNIRINLATVLCDLDSLEKGLEIFKQLLREDTKNFYASQNIGYFSMKNNQYDSALVYFNKTLEMNPKMAITYNNRGFLKHKLKDNKGALNDINTSLNLDSYNPYAYKNRAIVYVSEGMIEKACEDLRKARSLGYAEKYGDEVEQLIQKNCVKK